MASHRPIGAARKAVPLLLAAWLAACAGDPMVAFDLAPAASAPHRALRAQVHVLDPVATSDLDSERILVRTGPDGLAVMAGARWTAPLPQLLQARLNDSLQSAQGTTAAGESGVAAKDYNLETELRAFELDADQKQVAVELVVKLVSARDNHVVAVKTFKAQAPVASTDPGVVTAALNGALFGLMAQIVGFVAASV